jgi:hypothetical protein
MRLIDARWALPVNRLTVVCDCGVTLDHPVECQSRAVSVVPARRVVAQRRSGVPGIASMMAGEIVLVPGSAAPATSSLVGAAAASFG